MKIELCSHSEEHRTDLSNGKGFHCDECNSNIHTDGSTATLRYSLVKAEHDFPKGKPWQVWDLTIGGPLDGRYFTKKGAQEVCDARNHVPTVDSIPNATGDAAKDIAKRQSNEKQLKAELAATNIEAGLQEFQGLAAEHRAIRVKTRKVILAMEADYKNVCVWFRHKKDHEKLFGLYAIKGAWTKAIFDMTPEGIEYHFKKAKKVFVEAKDDVPRLAETTTPPQQPTPTASDDDGDDCGGLPEIPESEEQLSNVGTNWQNDAGETVAHIVALFDTVVDTFGPTERHNIYLALSDNINARLNERRNKRMLLDVTPKEETVVA